METVKGFEFYYDIYPNIVVDSITKSLTTGSKFQAPRCIFVPTLRILRTIIRALLKFGGSEDE